MTRAVTIALDAMGGDHGPVVVVPAAAEVLRRHPQVRLVLVGDERILTEHLTQQGLSVGERLSVRHASQTVGMD